MKQTKVDQELAKLYESIGSADHFSYEDEIEHNGEVYTVHYDLDYDRTDFPSRVRRIKAIVNPTGEEGGDVDVTDKELLNTLAGDALEKARDRVRGSGDPEYYKV